jgi:hypothetical protein
VILVGVHFALMEIARVLLGELKWPRVGLDEILAKLARNVVRENYKEFKGAIPTRRN